jgi:hypothetical protein
MSVDDRDGPAAPSVQPAFSGFEEALHTPFEVRLDDTRQVNLVLEEVTASGVRPGWESFSLIFDGPSPPVFSDGLFEVEHPELGFFPMFVVAVQTDGEGQQYEAVFKRRVT